MIRLIEHFVSKSAMDIEGMGGKTGITLIENGLIKNVSDIYNLKKGDLVELERMGDKSSTNLLFSIEISKNKNLSNLIFALGIKHVGSEIAEILSTHFHTMDNLIDASLAELETIDLIGPQISMSIIEYFNRPIAQSIISMLKEYGVNMTNIASNTEHILKNRRFVVTGKLDNYTRSEIINLIKDFGGSVSNKISNQTDYLIAGTDSGSKLSEAIHLKIPIIDEYDFLSLIKSI
jgi:DNA ligase (NAD+)